LKEDRRFFCKLAKNIFHTNRLQHISAVSNQDRAVLTVNKLLNKEKYQERKTTKKEILQNYLMRLFCVKTRPQVQTCASNKANSVANLP